MITATWHNTSTRGACARLFDQLVTMLELRLPFQRGRYQRISDGCKVLGEPLMLDAGERVALELAARYHDIGLLAVPDRILLKKQTLTTHERTAMDCHALIGGHLLHTHYPDFPEAVEAIWWHHERADGKGPQCLEGAYIPILAGTVHLVGALEAMGNERPYRKPLTHQAICAEVDRCAGTQFLSDVVQAFHLVRDRVLAAVVESDDAGARSMLGPRPSPKPASANQQPPAAGRGKTSTAGNQVRSAPTTPAGNGEFKPLIGREDLLSRVSDRLEIRPLPPAVQAVMSVTANSRCTIDEVAQAIMQDQTIALRLLRVANSPAYNRGRTCSSIKDAVGMVGIREVRQLATALGVLNQFEGSAGANPDPKKFWEHSIATGMIAARIGQTGTQPQSADYLLKGLLHDVGRLILSEIAPEIYAQVLQTAADHDLPLEVAEWKLLQTTHSEILARALECWHFSRDFIASVANHHAAMPVIRRLAPKHAKEAATIALADRLADALGFAASLYETIYPIHDLARELDLPAAALQTVIAEAPDEINAAKLSLMYHSRDTAWPDNITELRQRVRKPVRGVSAANFPHAAQILCSRIQSPGGEEPPNVGVICLSDAAEQERIYGQFERHEREAGVDGLPLVIVCDRGTIDPQQAWLKPRRLVLRQTPLSIDRLINTLNEVLS